jgi:hypothetical protein
MREIIDRAIQQRLLQQQLAHRSSSMISIDACFCQLLVHGVGSIDRPCRHTPHGCFAVLFSIAAACSRQS